MDEQKKAVFGAAVRAQERMIEYRQGVRTGLVKADGSTAELLVLACDRTFDAWMATGWGFHDVACNYVTH